MGHDFYRPVRTEVVDVKIKYWGTANTAFAKGSYASLCSTGSLKAFMTMWIRKIHSSTLLNFYLDFQNYSENVPHKRKKAVGQKGKILAQIQC